MEIHGPYASEEVVLLHLFYHPETVPVSELNPTLFKHPNYRFVYQLWKGMKTKKGNGEFPTLEEMVDTLMGVKEPKRALEVLHLLEKADASFVNGLDLNKSLTNLKAESFGMDELIKAAKALADGGMEEAKMRAIVGRLAAISTPALDADQAWKEVQVSVTKEERRERNISEQVEKWIEDEKGEFHYEQCCKYIYSPTLQKTPLQSARLKGSVRQVFCRLRAEGKIVGTGKRAGWYRKPDTDLVEIDYAHVSEEERMSLNLVWPFGIENLVQIHPRAIVIVAGTSDAGKTAFCLNFCRLNKDYHKINYFSCEMNKTDFSIRLEPFVQELGEKLSVWEKKVKMYERGGDFQDVIRPNEINIVDFLERFEDYPKVGADIKAIFDKLDKGIAIIAIQQTPFTNLGIGGWKSVEKSRLYLSLHHNEITIVKGKGWAGTRNPRGMKKTYTIRRGVIYENESDWEYGEIKFGGPKS